MAACGPNEVLHSSITKFELKTACSRKVLSDFFLPVKGNTTNLSVEKILSWHCLEVPMLSWYWLLLLIISSLLQPPPFVFIFPSAENEKVKIHQTVRKLWLQQSPQAFFAHK